MDCKKKKIAYHEVGHAVMALIHHQKIQKISLRGMESPNGTDRYHGFMRLETVDSKIKMTGEKAIQRIMISLGGFASEALFSGGSVNIGGDDLENAVKAAEDMLQIPEFKKWITGLPVPSPSPLDIINNQSIRAYIDLKMGDSIKTLVPLRPLIELIVEELYNKEELTGKEVLTIFNSFMKLKD